MAVSMDLVKKLRDITNAGMMECKKALENTNGNIDEALKYLKEKGLADAKKRSDREANEGGVYIAEKDNNFAIAKIACETDFVANNENFKKACQDIVNKIVETGNDDIMAYQEDCANVSQVTKENVQIKSAKYIKLKDNQIASSYIHGPNRIGVVAVFNLGDANKKSNDEIKEMAKNICLHIAASNPIYLTPEDVSEADIEEQKALFEKQMEGSDKKPEILAKMLEGKINKFKSEVSLTEQKYIKDEKITVKQYVEQVAKKTETDITIDSFVRFSIGE